MPTAHLMAILGIVAIYNGALTYFVSNPAKFGHAGRILSLVSRALDAIIITFVVANSGASEPLAYLLYWFVLVSFGYASVQMRILLAATGTLLIANGGATLYAINKSGSSGSAVNEIVIRSLMIVFGALVAAYISKSRSRDELASERGSHLHAILDCGARLTSFRNVHDLALYALESAVNQTGAAGGELLLVDDESGALECEAFFVADGLSGENATPAQALLRSYANWVVNSGREFLVTAGGRDVEDADVGADDRPAMSAPLLWQSSSSESENSVLGVLTVWGYPEENFGEDALDMLRIFAVISGAAIVNLRLYTNLQKSFLRTLQSLANGLEARDEYTRGHSERVMQVACMIARELEVPGESVDVLRNASLLHDIGKIGVPDAILRKAGKLSVEEWETMRRHPIVSEEICRPLGLPAEVLFLIKHHHERLDGKGYPSGLPSQEQPLLQRILVVSDSFDAMRSRRPYRDRMPQEELTSELNKSAGRTLDPTVVDALRRLMDRGDMDEVYEEHDRMIDGVSAQAKSKKQLAA
ncbi:MAG: HD domain-containing phosphohydrolase [Armatimonadota bacterium]|nr:HD domain-containing protein [bacterium]